MIYGLRLAMIWMALAVILGAAGAHSIKPQISADQYTSFRTGLDYQFYHALGIIAIALIMEAGWMDVNRGKWIIRLLTLGIVFFSGSIYLLSTRELTGWEWVHTLGPITPVGGISFVAAWLTAALSIKLPVLRD